MYVFVSQCVGGSKGLTGVCNTLRGQIKGFCRAIYRICGNFRGM